MPFLPSNPLERKLNKIIGDFYAAQHGRPLRDGRGNIHLWHWHGAPGPLSESATMPPKLDWALLKVIDFADPIECTGSSSEYVRGCKNYLLTVKHDKLERLIPWRASPKWRKRALSWYAGPVRLDKDALWDYLNYPRTAGLLTASFWAAMEDPLPMKEAL